MSKKSSSSDSSSPSSSPFIHLNLKRKKSVDSHSGEQKQRHDREASSSSSSTATNMNERTPLVPNAMPSPLVNRGHNHHMDVINTCNLTEAVQRQIDDRLKQARATEEATCILFAFVIVYGGGDNNTDACRTISNHEDFENDAENVLQLAPYGDPTPLDKLCLATQRFTKIYKQVGAMWRHIKQTEPQVHLILQKRSFKQRNTGSHVRLWDRLCTPLLNGDYYTIVADFVQGLM